MSIPTREIAFAPVTDPSDLPNAVIEDPRTLLLSLAEGTLLSRKYLLHEETRRERTVRVGEVRVYVLDGSGSMLLFGSGGARARVRDAVLLAELATMQRRLRDRRVYRAVLFYRYFDTVVGPITRIDSEELANAAMSEVVGTVRTGGTDIEAALLASFAQIGEARATDPDLARGHVVLVTDGDASVDEARVEDARRAVGIPVGLSVIALGMENQALRQLVARQRAAGARAFYHYLSDDELLETVGGRVDRGLALHLVHATRKQAPSPQERAEALEALLGELLDELAAIEHERHAALVDLDVEREDRAEAARASLVELGVDPGPRVEGDCARHEAIERDHHGLQIRFDRWFPSIGVEPISASPAEGTPEEASSTIKRGAWTSASRRRSEGDRG